MLEEIAEQMRTTPRNRQGQLGRKYCIKRLKSVGVKPDKYWWKYNNHEIYRLYKKEFGICDKFNKLKTRKKDNTAYLYYESIKGRFTNFGDGGVYIIGNIEKGVCKIGYSKNPHKRIKSIQTGCPYPISILKYYKGIGLREERLLHKKYSKYKLQGEWFEIKGGIKHELTT